MDSKAMVNEMEAMDWRLTLIRSQRFKKFFLFDNAAPHRAKVTTDKLAQLGYVHDFMVGRDTRTQADLDNHNEQWISTRRKQFWRDGIRKLADRWQQGH
ncbi:unnamed protein product [Heligmosomoides polygyrus]|uniref:DDE_3 domain-containing protein n=1 Tax=Heligmosomoides polygyrus TaxID=6339 RepID=A0A183FA43_HELPZ|nr:unnamed protein product [Heligmosomoides polygyrus]